MRKGLAGIVHVCSLRISQLWQFLAYPLFAERLGEEFFEGWGSGTPAPQLAFAIAGKKFFLKFFLEAQDAGL